MLRFDFDVIKYTEVLSRELYAQLPLHVESANGSNSLSDAHFTSCLLLLFCAELYPTNFKVIAMFSVEIVVSISGYRRFKFT